MSDMYFTSSRGETKWHSVRNLPFCKKLWQFCCLIVGFSSCLWHNRPVTIIILPSQDFGFCLESYHSKIFICLSFFTTWGKSNVSFSITNWDKCLTSVGRFRVVLFFWFVFTASHCILLSKRTLSLSVHWY